MNEPLKNIKIMKNTEKMIVTVTPGGTYQQVKKSEVRFVVDEEPKTTPKIQEVANAIVPSIGACKVWSVMMFWRACEIADTDSKEWVCRDRAHFTDHYKALNCYANTPCPASQIMGAASEEELEAKEKQMIENYKSEEWLEENLYPYI